jgi:hypothetical protein
MSLKKESNDASLKGSTVGFDGKGVNVSGLPEGKEVIEVVGTWLRKSRSPPAVLLAENGSKDD